MEKYVIANWKMNGDTNFIENYFEEFSLNPEVKLNVIFCPMAPFLRQTKELIPQKNLSLGAQDCHFAEQGAFTGDISPKILQELGVDYVILGHSERRQYQFETNKLIAKKAIAAQEHELIPIICVGETLAERQNKSYKDVIKQQLAESVPIQLKKKYIIAYEPVWAIGTGITPKYDEIIEIFDLISSYQPNISILYGGSVNSVNSSEFAKLNNLAGFLVGSASLKAAEFRKIALSLQ